MPHRVRVALIIVALMLLVPEAFRLSDLFEEAIQVPREWLRSLERNAPPPMLLRRDGDGARFPRGSFGFVFGGERGEKIDTWSGVVTKDMVAGPDTTIQLSLSEEQLDTIYAKALDIRLFDDLQLDPATKDQGRYFPHASVSLVVRAGSTQRELRWDSSYRGAGKWRDDWKRLDAWTRLVVRIVHNRPEYQALPPARGAYQ